MKLTDYLLAELEREATRTHVVLLDVPAGKYEWKPHDTSMRFGNLAEMVAIIPTWIGLQVTHNDLDIAPVDGKKILGEPKTTSEALIKAFDEALLAARTALKGTTDEHLSTTWQLKRRGEVVQEAPRYQMMQDTFNHWSHHRGQMTVYLRLLGAMVPSTYGPSADDQTFR